MICTNGHFSIIKLCSLQFDSLKTSLLKWRPDYDIAADEYAKAGNLVLKITLVYHLSIILLIFSHLLQDCQGV
jgi:hypothetical protein